MIIVLSYDPLIASTRRNLLSILLIIYWLCMWMSYAPLLNIPYVFPILLMLLSGYASILLHALYNCHTTISLHTSLPPPFLYLFYIKVYYYAVHILWHFFWLILSLLIINFNVILKMRTISFVVLLLLISNHKTLQTIHSLTPFKWFKVV